ncbi:trypsin-like peptidase domain-containing protein [Actinoplanes sp. LDG1-06]|uniref:Trypsin-like peptidase domain-containing protein n=1 Tax=Paractinoplanes ovalisporus TaxID=2810368 RepID=A0ABS2AMU8_9ACTN|nr:trypsin-like peptidase domain-containing protein [Actinoplanes ovalisporus]MBM2621172.1 trypsin-like peptidase domain-containing protein [Actinoplanes ovalisporus]
MNENETDPRPTDASSESSSPERGQSEQPTAVQPAAPQPPAAPHAPQWARPVSSAPQPSVPQSAAPHSGVPQSAAPQSGVPQSAVPQSGVPVTGAPQWNQQPHHPQQSPWQQAGYQPGHPGYPQQPQPSYPPYGAYAGGWEGATQAQHQGQHQTQPLGIEGQAWSEGQTWSTSAHGQPAWAQPVGQQPPRNPGRGRKIFVAGAAAVVIALAAGGVGAATALAFDDGGSSPSVQTGNSSVTRVVDRSSLAQIAAAVQDSVVSITTGSGEGSGVVISGEGFIVTNNHVVASAQGKSVTVIFANGTKSTATIVGTDERTDLAVVKVSGVSDLKPATFGSSAKMQVGDTVLAIGSPLGLEGSVTAGIISAKDRTITSSSGDQGQGQEDPFGQQQQQQQGSSTTMSGLLQTDAPINPGNSGGALVNTNGEIIGINSAIATQGSGTGNIGLGFAIPSDKAKQVVNDLMAGKKVSHPALGVSVTAAENGGALVSQVTPNSAAAKAGLQQGDVITSADGKAVGDSEDLIAAVQGGKVGQQMVVQFTRNGEKKEVTVTLTEAQ